MKSFVLFCIIFTLACSLEFNENGKFKIVQFTDLHFGETEGEDEKTYQMMKMILEKEKPDLVAVTGDVVSGYAWDEKTRPWYAVHYEKFTQALREMNQPWAMIAGNHDREADLNAEEVLQNDLKYAPLSLTLSNERNLSHPFNYFLDITAHNKPEEKITRLWFIDTGREDCLQVSGYDCIRPDQIQWFLDESKKQEGSWRENGIAFIHIPLPEYLTMRNDCETYGQQRDHVGCSSINSGFFSAAKFAGTVSAITCGHDHNNDFTGEYEGIKLMYGRKTGFGSYGPKYIQRGARVIELTQDPYTMVTHIRQEDGSVESSQELHKPTIWWWEAVTTCSYADVRNDQILEEAKTEETRKLWKSRLDQK